MYNRGLGQDCSAGPACAWYDNVYATQGCLNWYAACDPTNPFYVLNTKGLIVGGAGVLGQTAGSAVAAAGNSFLGLDPSSGIPTWIWAVGLVGLGVMLIPRLVK